ncbi:MAG: hypothetical protein Q8O89_01895 [Nanoarchaeota archaeon]|nr:hypothetical protein [Nanoarchaeota archaeon]
MKCELCTYEWQPRVDNPKACPRCKRRFDYNYAKVLKTDSMSNIFQIKNDEELENINDEKNVNQLENPETESLKNQRMN